MQNRNVSDRYSAIHLSGSDFYETYQLKNIHLHWGENDYQGSEHTVNGHKHPLEVTFDLYCNQQKNVTHGKKNVFAFKLHLVHQSPSGNLTVLGFLFQVS